MNTKGHEYEQSSNKANSMQKLSYDAKLRCKIISTLLQTKIILSRFNFHKKEIGINMFGIVFLKN